MRLYVTAKTEMTDLAIDYIEVKLQSGETVSLNWDESNYGINDGLFTATYRSIPIAFVP